MTKDLTLSSHSRGSAHPLWIRINAFLLQKSTNTQITYASVVTEWCNFLGAEAGTPKAATLFLAATDLHATAYLQWLNRRPGETPRMLKGASKPVMSTQRALSKSRMADTRSQKRDGLQSTLANATIAKKFAALRRIYRMAIATDLGVTKNPFDVDRVPPPSKQAGQKRPTEMVKFELVKEILELPDQNTPKGLRDRAILALLFGGGLRRSEVCGLRIGDVRRTQKGTVFLQLRATKAKKDAHQAIPAWAAKSVQALIQQRVKEGASAGDYLIIGYRGQGGKSPSPDPISDNGLYRLFKSYCMRGGAGSSATPHSARATAITKLLSDGIPHREVQEFSRHSSIAMVELYDKRRIGVDENPGKELDYD